METASLTLRHITAWQTEHVSFSLKKARHNCIHLPGGSNHKVAR